MSLSVHDWPGGADGGAGLPIDPGLRFHRGAIRLAKPGTLVLRFGSLRPFRLGLDNSLLLDVMKVLLGLASDALGGRLTWRVPASDMSGVRRFPLGPAMVNVACRVHDAHLLFEASTDAPFTLILQRASEQVERFCPPGTTRVTV